MIKVKTREAFLSVVETQLPSMCKAVEIGVLYGGFAEEIIRIINPRELVLVDPFTQSDSRYGKDGLHTAYSTETDYQELIRKFDGEIMSGRVKVVRLFSYHAVEHLVDSDYDFIYIDASHLYHDVKRDLNDWLPKLKRGGVIAGHDYVDYPEFGVIKAVDEFIEEHGFEMTIFNTEGGDWALQKI